jgi:hypothetical protein
MAALEDREVNIFSSAASYVLGGPKRWLPSSCYQRYSGRPHPPAGGFGENKEERKNGVGNEKQKEQRRPTSQSGKTQQPTNG